MEQTYSHHHLTDAQHSGLVIGAIAGSTLVVVIVAVAVVISSPGLIIHPLNFKSQITVQPQKSSQSVTSGPAATLAQDQFKMTPEAGSAATAVENFSQQ